MVGASIMCVCCAGRARTCALVHLPEETLGAIVGASGAGFPFERANCRYGRWPAGRVLHMICMWCGVCVCVCVCRMCEEGTVPSMLLATTECPEGLPIAGR